MIEQSLDAPVRSCGRLRAFDLDDEPLTRRNSAFFSNKLKG